MTPAQEKFADGKLRATKDYSLFAHSQDNRDVDPSKRKGLVRSMEKYGFIRAYPLHCIRNGNLGKFVIIDGQGRFYAAQQLGLPVWFVVCDENVNPAEINAVQRRWTMEDYAKCFAAQGKKDYIELLAFHEQHGIPLGACANMLYNVSMADSNTHVVSQIKKGVFVVKTRAMADQIARIYCQVGELSRAIKTNNFIGALFAASLVKGFDAERIITGAKGCPELLKSYSTRDGYLEMLEALYNHRRTAANRVPLKFEAERALLARNKGKVGREIAK